MQYFLYETKNLINGKIYIGVHSTDNSEDRYLGSGKVLITAIKKYGIENFQRTILEEFPDAISMYTREAEIVNEEFLKRKDVYNIRLGGSGGWEFINNDPTLREKASIASRKYNKDNDIGGTKHWTEAGREKIIETAKANQSKAVEAYKLAMSDPEFASAVNAKISKTNSGRGNSQYGSRDYVNIETKEIKRFKEDQQPFGWITTKIYKKQLGNIEARWYTDGSRIYLLTPSDKLINELNLKRKYKY